MLDLLQLRLAWRLCLFVLGLRSHSIALYKGKQSVAGTTISITNTSNVDDQCLHLHGGFGTEGGKINSAAMDHLCDFVPLETTTYSWKCYHGFKSSLESEQPAMNRSCSDL